MIKPENIGHGEREMHIVISDDLAQGRQPEELEKAVREGLLLRDYVKAEISIGKFAELMKLDDEEARDWLHQHGIATSQRFTDPELEKAEEAHYRKVTEELDSAVPK